MTSDPLYVVVETAPCPDGGWAEGTPCEPGEPADYWGGYRCDGCLKNSRRLLPETAEPVERVEARSSDPRAVFYRTPNPPPATREDTTP